MKKIISVALALVMLLAMAVPAFAVAETVQGLDGTKNTIPADTKDSGTIHITTTAVDTVYYVTTDWESMTFTYTAATWDPENVTYTGSGWTDATAAVTVTNKSNADVKVDAALSSTVAVNGVSVALDKTTTTLPSAAVAGEATEDSFTVTVSGTPTATSFDWGTLTLTFLAP